MIRQLILTFALIALAISSGFCNKANDSLLGSFSDLPLASQSRVLDAVIYLIDRRNTPWASSTKTLSIPLTDEQQLSLYTPDERLVEQTSIASSEFSTRDLGKRIDNFLSGLKWRERVSLKSWLPRKSESPSSEVTRCRNILSNYENLVKIHNLREIYELPGFWSGVKQSSSQNKIRNVSETDFRVLQDLSMQEEPREKFIHWGIKKWSSEPISNVQSGARKLAEAYRENSLKFASDTMDFEQAQSQITAQYRRIKDQFLSYGIKEPAPESSLYSDYVELEFFTNISETDYQYLGNDAEEVQIALNKRRQASEAILDRMSRLAEQLHDSAQWIKNTQAVISRTFRRVRFLDLGKIAFTVQQTKAVEGLKKLNMNSLLSVLADYGPLHQLGEGDFNFGLQQVSELADKWMQLTLTEFQYLVKVRQHEDNIQDQIQKIENLHYDKIGALNNIPELKERIRQINEFNLDMISRADGNLMQRNKNLQSFFDFAQRRIDGLATDVGFLAKVSNHSIKLGNKLANLLSQAEQDGITHFITEDEYIKQKIDLARSFTTKSMAYILNGYNQKERDEVVGMHTRVHEDNLKSLEKAIAYVKLRKDYAAEVQMQMKQLLLTARLHSTTISDVKTLREIRSYIEMQDFSPITYLVSAEPKALQIAHQEVLDKISALGEKILNQ